MVGFDGMPERVALAFHDYILLGRQRTLRALAALLASRDLPGSIATLKRWSAQYHWQERVIEHERAVVADMQTKFTGAMDEKISNDFEAIAAVKERFYARILVDPNDPNLTPAQRKRALKPTLRDFFKLLKIEQLLRGSLAIAQTPSAGVEEQSYTQEELGAMAKALAQVRYGLPHKRSTKA